MSFGCGGPGWSSQGGVASHLGGADSLLAASQSSNGVSHDGASHDGASHNNGVSPPVSPASIMPSPYEPSHRWGTLTLTLTLTLTPTLTLTLTLTLTRLA